jgi:hypothetical protein
MIKMSGTSRDGKRRVVLLGLSEGNLMRLREKKPIVINGEEMMMPELDIIICWGETEDKLAEELNYLISSETRVRDQRGDKKN